MALDKQRSTLASNHDFQKLWAGQTLSVFGSLIGKCALPFLLVYTLHATSGELAWVRVFDLVPGILAGLFLGVVIDRIKRRPLLFWTDVLRALFVTSIPVALWFHTLTMVQILIVSAVVSVLTVSFDIGYDAYLPSLVGSHQVTVANAKMSATWSIAEVTGFGISGLMFQAIGGALTLFTDAITFAISFLTLTWIRHAESHTHTREDVQTPVIDDIRAGWQVLKSNQLLRTLTLVSALISTCSGAMSTLDILYLGTNLHLSAAVQGVLFAVGGVSSLLGAAVAQRVFQRVGLRGTLRWTLLLGTIACALIPLAFGPFWLVALCLLAQQLLGDGADTIYDIHVSSLRQTIVPNRYLGRINAMWQVTSRLFMLMGILGAGLIPYWLGLRTTLFVAVGVRALAWAWLTLSRSVTSSSGLRHARLEASGESC